MSKLSDTRVTLDYKYQISRSEGRGTRMTPTQVGHAMWHVAHSATGMPITALLLVNHSTPRNGFSSAQRKGQSVELQLRSPLSKILFNIVTAPRKSEVVCIGKMRFHNETLVSQDNYTSCRLLYDELNHDAVAQVKSAIAPVLNALGILANCLFLFLSLAKKEVDGDYKWFFINLAACDLGFSAAYLALMLSMSWACWIDDLFIDGVSVNQHNEVSPPCSLSETLDCVTGC